MAESVIEVENEWADTLTRISTGKSSVVDAECVRALVRSQLALRREVEKLKLFECRHFGGYVLWDDQKWWASHLLTKAEETARQLREENKRLKAELSGEKGWVRYRIELKPGHFNHPHHYTGFDRDGSVNYSTFAFKHWKKRQTAEKHLAMIRESGSTADWVIVEYGDEP
jgi:hypothetical protein